MTQEHTPITSLLVPNNERFEFLPAAFGAKHMLTGESYVYDWMTVLSTDYKGGYWNFYRLSNGGFFMAPASPKTLNVKWPGNYFNADMSAEAAGIVATLFAINQLCHETHIEEFADKYYQLIAFAREHEESVLITQIID